MNFDMIRDAATRAKGHVRRTPLLSSPFLDEVAGKRVFVKAECLQHTGSFKFRGAWSAMTGLKPENGVIAFSSGNHAQAVALAAKLHGQPAVIVMPTDSPAIKMANTRAYGAEVVTYDRETESREEIGERIASERGLTLIRPFDEPYVIAGQGTCGLEIAAQAAEAGITEADVIVCCGGGGLTSGIALALAAEAPSFRVHGAEPEGFDDMKRSLASGRIESNPSGTGSICDAIISRSPGELTFPILQRLLTSVLVVRDDDCLRAMGQAFNRLRLVLEPGGAAALAAGLYHARGLDAETVIVTASGGNVDAAMYARALATLE